LNNYSAVRQFILSARAEETLVRILFTDELRDLLVFTQITSVTLFDIIYRKVKGN